MGQRKEAPRAKKRAAAAARTNIKAEVIALMKRAKGVSLAEITEATGWQKNTARLASASSAARAARRSNPRRMPTGSRVTASLGNQPAPRDTSLVDCSK
jgi:hypothetical protein